MTNESSGREPKYWVVASGTENRDLFEVFKRFGILAVGPGRFGNFKKHKRKYLNLHDRPEEIGAHDLSSIQFLAENAHDGDFVVARRGLKTVVAVGKIKSNYKHAEVLQDVYGWDMQHYAKVDWKEKRGNFRSLSFSRGYNFCELHRSKEASIERRFHFKNIRLTRKKLPKKLPKKVSSREMNKFLSKRLVNKLNRVLDYYETVEETEDEIIHFVLLPFLKELGWTYKDIRIKECVKETRGHGFVDILIEKDDDIFCVIEVKRLYRGLGKTVKKQALDYVNKLKKDPEEPANPKYFLLTDGKHYYLYKVNKPNKPYAYLRLDRKGIYEKHPLFPYMKGPLKLLQILKKDGAK